MEKDNISKKASSQVELFEAQTHWFHIFRAMIDNGELAKMEGSTVKVYLVIKAHTNYSTGRSFPGIDLIAEKSGISEPQVKRCIKELEEMGYITKTKVGRHNNYMLREKVAIHDGDGRPTAEATWDYLPSTVKHAVADLQKVLLTGDFAGAQIVHIDRLNVQIINGGENNNITQINESDIEASLEKIQKSDPAMYERLMGMRMRSKT